MPSTPTAEQAGRAVDRLRVLTPAQAIRDPELNRALEAFRGQPPVALLCGNARCTRPLVWCALDRLTGRVRFGATAPGPDGWEAGEDGGEQIAPPGEPLLRWRFRCERCERPCVLTNGRMIVLIVRAVAAGRSAIRPAAEG